LSAFGLRRSDCAAAAVRVEQSRYLTGRLFSLKNFQEEEDEKGLR